MSLSFRLRFFLVSALLLLVPFVLVDALVLRPERSGAGPSIVPSGAIFSIAIAALLAAVSSRWLASEVRRVTDAARRMADGDLAIRTRISGSDEIGALGAALDRLAESLSSAMGELRAERDLVSGILDGMREGVLLVDARGRIRLVNPTLREVLLLAQDVVDRPLIEVIRHAALMDLFDAARTSRAVKSAEIELGGLKPRRLLVRAAPLATDTKSLLAVFVDVTDLRRLESMRRDFVANVSHELRTPVTAVQSAAETLAGGAIHDEVAAKRFVDIIERNSARLCSLIDDLLDLSRIEAREFRLRHELVDLPSLIGQALNTVRERAEKRRVELVVTVEAAARSLVCDRRALEQVLVNLVENAVKYCPDSRVVISARPVSAGAATSALKQNAIVIAVSDNGPGIEPRHLERIFERFYRVDAGRSRELGGTGLGLSIVKHLAEAMGGAVTVASKVGEGTTFSVELPSKDESDAKLPVKDESGGRLPL